MPTQETVENAEQLVDFYNSSFTADLNRGGGKYLAIWFKRHAPIYAGRFKNVVEGFRKKSGYSRPPIRDVCEAYERVTRSADRVRNTKYCQHCRDSGFGSVLRVYLDGRHYYVTRQRTFARKVDGMWVDVACTAEYQYSQAIIPCSCAKGQDYRERRKFATRALEYLQRHCWMRYEDIEAALDEIFAEPRKAALQQMRAAENRVRKNKAGGGRSSRKATALPNLSTAQAREAAQSLEALRCT